MKKTTKANVKQLLLKESVAEGKFVKKAVAKNVKKTFYFNLEDFEDQTNIDSD